MTYIGEVHNGVVILRNAPALREGMEVRVEVQSDAEEPQRGNIEAVLESLKNSKGWDGPEGELDRLLAEVREMKWDEVRLQQAQPEPEL